MSDQQQEQQAEQTAAQTQENQSEETSEEFSIMDEQSINNSAETIAKNVPVTYSEEQTQLLSELKESDPDKYLEEKTKIHNDFLENQKKAIAKTLVEEQVQKSKNHNKALYNKWLEENKEDGLDLSMQNLVENSNVKDFDQYKAGKMPIGKFLNKAKANILASNGEQYGNASQEGGPDLNTAGGSSSPLKEELSKIKNAEEYYDRHLVM